MDMKLAENIRTFRKERSLTQEQLSEVLGVTAGAVYKWEAGLSVPDIQLIMEMADFFDTSVDVLLGYEMKDNRLDATVKRLQEYRRQKDRAGLAEAEKALKKYPHSFRIVNECSSLYRGLRVRQRRQGYTSALHGAFGAVPAPAGPEHGPGDQRADPVWKDGVDLSGAGRDGEGDRALQKAQRGRPL